MAISETNFFLQLLYVNEEIEEEIEWKEKNPNIKQIIWYLI